LPQVLRGRQGTLMLRSVFLQGALLMPDADLPKHLRALQSAREAIGQLAQRAGESTAQMALRLAVAEAPGTAVVIGAETVAQAEALASLAEVFETQGAPFDDAALAAARAAIPPAVLDPRVWPR